MSPAGTADEELIRALFEDHGGPLYGYVLRLTGDPGRAEDVVQETLLRAWRHPSVLEGRPVRAWLFTVARNLVVDQHRARKSRPKETSDEALAVLPADDELEKAVESWGIADALASLRPEHREVLMETYYRGRSVKEASEILGIPPGTVKSRTYYALRALKLALEERGLAP
ncbi:sigma-70 family RNA polymerase sigma factor [Planotetraspora sp. A-T 1434]|uniref:sigma-70 family RNA polymerase sigma factor n=1 Tax=Planotetraspora sp. A-T 1434 TaxID=2979219 RepID=UPI0021BFB6FB|nr:sigma-70 family RNA polymerase sigma factor [Planotetraspora sp. A-T 1434]MCT9934754.1 sigma-70 family RNA polymerase sigma factor [Planotetraspora sp. A-T 1434]